MPLVYFNSYQTGPGDQYQVTGSTATWTDNTDTSGFSAFTGDNQFWPSPSAGNDGDQNSQNFIICWADSSVSNTTAVDEVTAKVSYWAVDYSEEETGYLDWLNEAIRCAGGNPRGSLSQALTEAATSQVGIWTNYNTDITPGLIQ